MALEKFRTQVLLLHSQQRILDWLSAGFDDRYAVHQATSGSEALSALATTPIDILVSAQNLPGMSGIEALHEAKRRLPGMVGILLADDTSDADQEALVGGQAMFQVVYGDIDPGKLFRIVQSAARDTRMPAMPESANDNEARGSSAANRKSVPDAKTISETGEHIVMETLGNGAAIVTDGSERVLAVNRTPADNATAEDTGRVSVLILSRDGQFIAAVRAAAQGMHSVHHAESPQQALDLLAGHNVGVLITDAAVAGNNVTQLMQKLRKESPRLVGIVAGRRDDGEALMDLINRGHIYRFLLKPLSPGRARLAIEASAKYHIEAPEAAFRVRQQAATAAGTAGPAAIPAQQPGTPTAVTASEPPRPAPPTTDKRASTQAGNQAVQKLIASQVLPARRPSRKASSRLRGLVGLLAVIAAGGAWFLWGPNSADNLTVPGPLSTQQSPPVAASDASALPAVPSQPTHAVFLDNARFARDSGRVLSPPGDNAIEWYLEARRARPDDVIVREELAALVDQVMGSAELAMLEDRHAEAEATLAMVALADPDNPRLAFISAQLEQARLQDTLDAARTAIRDARFQDASQLLARAAELPAVDARVIDQLAADLASARSAQRIDDVLASANQRIAADQLTTPANDNARYFFELAASIEPDNAAARQGLLVIASKLVLRARTSMDQGELQTAAAYLREARELDPNSPEIQAAIASLQSSLGPATPSAGKPAAAVATRPVTEVQDAAQQSPTAAADRVPADAGATVTALAPTGASASGSGASSPLAVRTATTNDGTEAAGTSAASAPQPTVPAASAAANTPSTDHLGDGSSSMSGPGDSDLSAVPAQAGDAAAPATAPVPAATRSSPTSTSQPDTASRDAAEIKLVPVSDMVRTRYIAPRYPRAAQRRNLSGFVDVRFVVEANGEVGDIEILSASPSDVFDDAAMNAVAKWRYEPSYEDGRAVARRVAVRISFNLE